MALGPEHNRIFRITHVRNVPWILQHGLHCRNSGVVDPDFIVIGSPELIAKRSGHAVNVPPGGTLADYVPFYFTSHSKMFYNIHRGTGVLKRPNADIAIIVSSLDHLAANGVPYLFTTGHAYMAESVYCSDKKDLSLIDWPLLNSRDFTNDPNNPGKSARYQAEALVHRHVPVSAVLGIACYDQATSDSIASEAARLNVQVNIQPMPRLYFE